MIELTERAKERQDVDMKYPSLLIVDDEFDLADVIRELMSDMFDVIHVCGNGQEALNFLQQNEVSIILSDISMPQMTGDKFLMRLRSVGIFTPVIFLTGNATKDIAVTAVKLGATDFLEKPFDPNDLRRAITLSLQIENHKKQMHSLETKENPDKDLLRSEKKNLGIKQAALTLKKSG